LFHTVRLAIVIFALLLCGATGRAAEATRIRVGVPTLNMVVIAFTAGKENGYYREEGLDVDFVWMSAPMALQALIGGSVEFTTVTGSAMPAMLAGAPLVNIFSSYQRPMYWLFSKPEINSVRELKGRKVGVSGIGSGPATVLAEVLKKNGLEGGRDVPLLALGRMPDAAAGLFSGTVDAAMLAPPFNITAKESGFRELVSFLKEDFVELQGSIVLREELLKSNPALVERFSRATLKGLMYAREQRSGTVAVLVRYLKINKTDAEKYYDSVREVMTRDGTVNERLVQKLYHLAVERFKPKDPPPIDRIFDFSMSKKINGQLQAVGWRPKP